MINMLKLGYTPNACCWVHKRGQAMGMLAMYASFPYSPFKQLIFLQLRTWDRYYPPVRWAR